MEGAALQCRETFRYELCATVDEPCFLGAVLECFARDVVVIGFVWLSQVGRVGEWDRAFRAHPVKGGARIEAARKRNTDSFAYRNPLEDSGHAIPIIIDAWP